MRVTLNIIYTPALKRMCFCITYSDLYPWGAYCESFHVSPADNDQRVVELLNAAG